MVVLNLVKPLPPNSEWAYLYAVANIYQNESGPYFDKAHPEAPHPLMDKEVQEILARKYGLHNVHRNTIASIRGKLTEYFGIHFGVKRKGKFILKVDSNVSGDEFALAAHSIAHSPSLTWDQAKRVSQLMADLCPLTESKKRIREYTAGILTNGVQIDIAKKASLISKAITDRKRIRFKYPDMRGEVVMRKPLSLFFYKDRYLMVSCEQPKDWLYWGKASNDYDLRLMEDVKII